MPTKSRGAGRVRIIGGAWRGRKLAVVAGIRPTPDRARETLFNWLGSEIRGGRVLDLFAGTGALGFEALSRGARHATFVEQDRAVARTLQRHREALGANAAVHRAEALAWLGRQDPAELWDVVFLDPPFGFGLQEAALEPLAGRLAENGAVYVEADAPQDLAAIAERCGLRAVRTSHAGGVAYGLLRVG